MRCNVPAPCFESIAGSLVQVTFHYDAIWCIWAEVHNGVIIRNILKTSIQINLLLDTFLCIVFCIVPMCTNTFFLTAACLCSMSLFSLAEFRTNWVYWEKEKITLIWHVIFYVFFYNNPLWNVYNVQWTKQTRKQVNLSTWQARQKILKS